MSRVAKPINQASAAIDVVTAGDVALVNVAGLVDERFDGFGAVKGAKSIVINVTGVTRMTSFGVRQWLKAMDALPKTASEILLLGCPTFFVDQLNMVLNFGGAGKVLTVIAPYTCPSCGAESGELIDVLAEHANLANGGLPDKDCARCGGRLEFDETPESYFSFVSKYAATSIKAPTAEMLAERGLYTSTDSQAEKPPKIIKLVHGAVTYFRVIGRIGPMFRARPFLVGAEGEVVIDLHEVDRFDPSGQNEWRRLLKSLSGQIAAVTIVDLKVPDVATIADTLTLSDKIIVASVLLPYRCVDCGHVDFETESLATWPPTLENGVCRSCKGITRCAAELDALAPLQQVSRTVPPASAGVIEQREKLVARALAEANVAQSSEAVGASDDAILGKYKIARRLTMSGIGEVFLAKQVGIGGFEKPVFLRKIDRKLLETRKHTVQQFLNDVTLAGRLNHPNIAQVLDVGESGEALYVASEYVHGTNLRDVIEQLQLRNTAMALGDACHVVREVAQALDHAFCSADMTGQPFFVVHGDVTPDNVLVSWDGAVKLQNFGIAKSLSDQTDPGFIAPEVGSGQIDHRSDLYSLGALLYMLCSGSTPFPVSVRASMLGKMKKGRYRPLTELVPDSERLDALIVRMLAPQLEDRPQRGQEIVAELTDMMRQQRLESSGISLSRLLSQMFPNRGESSEPSSTQGRRASTSTPAVRQSSITTVPATNPSRVGWLLFMLLLATAAAVTYWWYVAR